LVVSKSFSRQQKKKEKVRKQKNLEQMKRTHKKLKLAANFKENTKQSPIKDFLEQTNLPTK